MDDKWIVVLFLCMFVTLGFQCFSADRRDENIKKAQISALAEIAKMRVEAAKACNGNTECMEKIFEGVDVGGNSDGQRGRE